MEVLQSMVETVGLVDHQISSYNAMIRNGLQAVVEEEQVIEVTDETQSRVFHAEFGQVHVDTPRVTEEDRTVRLVTPNECRNREWSYDAPVSVDIVATTIRNGVVTDVVELNKHVIGRIPVMVGSCRCVTTKMSRGERIAAGECPHDKGGYFITRGKERVLVGQERMNYNRINCFRQKPTSKYAFVAEVRTMSPTTGHSVLTQCVIDKAYKRISFSLPYIQSPGGILVGIVFRAMGLSVDEFRDAIGPSSEEGERFCDIIDQEFIGSGIETQDQALEYIGRHSMHVIAKDKWRNYGAQVLENEMLPHMGVVSHVYDRATYMGSIVKKLINTVSGERSPDDRDNLANKRFEVAGVLICTLFRSLFKRLVRSLTPVVQKRPDIDVALGRFNTITTGYRQCMGTGKWGVQKNSYVRMGVSQVLVRLTYIATMSHLRRLVIPIGKEGKNPKIRQLHGSQFFFICLFETPEGQASGINKNLCIGATATNGCPSALVAEVLLGMPGLIRLSGLDSLRGYGGHTRLHLNGDPIGLTSEPKKAYEWIRGRRACGSLHWEVSVAWDDTDNEIHVASDSGRLIRPLFTLTDGKMEKLETTDWHELLVRGRIVFRDPAELENLTVAMNEGDLETRRDGYEYDLMEIHPSLMMGVCAATIPFPDHSQAPRNTYQSAMCKQALGIHCLSNSVRTDTIVHEMPYSQMPLTKTIARSMMGSDHLPCGNNILVAILTYTGFNQEDSVILNKASVDRGLFRVYSYRVISHTEKKRGTNCSEEITLPPLDSRKKFLNYSTLGPDGVARVGARIEKNDAVIGRILKVRDRSTGVLKIRDCSIAARSTDAGIVDSVYTGTTPDSFRFVKIKIRKQRIPEVGDKCASSEAQKGTIGAILAPEDMPFTEEGEVPDMIVNPHCLIGDTRVTYHDGTVGYIKDMFDKDVSVATIDPETLEWTGTKFVDGFKKDCTRLLEVRTISGRTVGCTPEHLWLVRESSGQKVWKKTEDLVPIKDKIIVRHSVLPVPGDDGKLPVVRHTGHPKYTRRLEKLGLTGQIGKRASLILARLLGLVDSDGHLSYAKSKGRQTQAVHHAVFFVGEYADVKSLTRDVVELGFDIPRMKQLKNNLTKEVRVEASLGSLLIALGACPGNKKTSERTFPAWILEAPSDVRREFLSGYNGGDGSKLSINRKTRQQQIRHRGIRMRGTHETESSHREYLSGLQRLFADFGIKTSIQKFKAKQPDKVDLMLVVSLVQENLNALVDHVGWRYCAQKERESRLNIEILKTRLEMARETGIPKLGLTRPVEIFGRWFRDDAALVAAPMEMSADFFERWFTEDVAVPVESVREIPPEPVYDFTTLSSNHSFVANGLVSHNCIPSRMTINQLIESLGNWLVLETGERRDATAFSKSSTNIVPWLQEKLKGVGLSPNGTRVMRSGFTGKKLEVEVFVGLTYYQKLKHMVSDKLHARAHGPLQALTRQPTEGRSREGGMRLGEMERDCLIGHGSAMMTVEKMLDLSDPFVVDVCRTCKNITDPACCRFCGSEKIALVKIPYACKLLFHELMAMGIRIDLIPEE